MKILSKDLLFSDTNKVISSGLSDEYVINYNTTRSIDYPAVTYNNGTFYFHTYSGIAFTTTDCESFSVLYSLGGTQNITLTKVIDNDIYYFGKNSNNLYIFGNSTTPKIIGTYDGGRITDAIYAANKYIVTGINGNGKGTIRLSNDLNSFSEPTIVANGITTVCFANDFFVFGCSNGYVYTSIDGISTNNGIKTPLDNIRKIIYSDKYIAIGEHQIATSRNGIDWKIIKTYDNYSLIDIVYYNFKYAVIGSINNSTSVYITTLDLKTFKETSFSGRSIYANQTYPNNRIAAGNDKIVLGYKSTSASNEQSGSRYSVWSI